MKKLNPKPKTLSKLTTELNEKIFELEIKSADNRILQEQLQLKNSENAEMQNAILSLRKQINLLLDKTSTKEMLSNSDEPQEVYLNETVSQEHSKHESNDSNLNFQILMQAAEIENLRQEKVRLVEEKDGLEIQSQKLAGEASYAKELAAAAAVELRNLAEEVTKLSYENEELTSDLAAANEACSSYDSKKIIGQLKRPGNEVLIEELKKDLNARLQREAALEEALSVKDETEAELRRTLDEIKCQKQDLENELTSMRALVAKMKKSGINVEDKSTVHIASDLLTRIRNGLPPSNGYSCRKQYKEDETIGNMEDMFVLEELKASYQSERRRCKELESRISRLKGEDIAGLDNMALEELQNLHIEAITKICHAKYANQSL